MTEEEYQQYTSFLRPQQWEELGRIAKRMGVGSRQPLIRWAIDAFLMSKASTYRTDPHVEEQTAEAA